MGPNIEPCGIPDESIWKTLSVPFFYTLFYTFEVWMQKSYTFSDKPYTWSFAAVKYSQKPWKDP